MTGMLKMAAYTAWRTRHVVATAAVRDANAKIEHLFLPWEDVDLSTLSMADDYAAQRGRTLLISRTPAHERDLPCELTVVRDV